MIIYSGVKSEFLEDCLDHNLVEKISAAMEKKLHRHSGRSEVNSWENSLRFMGLVLNDDGIPPNAGIAIEYNIPATNKRVDMIISGNDAEGRHSAIIVELKQWEEVEMVPGRDGIVRTVLHQNMVETTHPSYQAWSYVETIRDYNESVQNDDVVLSPCAYLHNYDPKPENDPIENDIYRYYFEKAPLFFTHDARKLREFIKKYIKTGDDRATLFILDNGRIRPSKSLQNCLKNMIEGKPEFIMLDEQKVVYEAVMERASHIRDGDGKRTIIIKGGPGTGKSVLAINLLVYLTAKGMLCTYVSKNSAPREVYSSKLKGSVTRSSVDNLFKGSGAFIESLKNDFDVIVTDEAHRLNEKSGLYGNEGENQIKEIINASRLSVFFIDEDQRIRVDDIGTVDNIRGWAGKLGSEVEELELASQFRCNGSDGYISWLDDVLQLRETANFDTVEDIDYDLRIFDDPCEMRREIEKRNEVDDRARIVAGFCWKWNTKTRNDPNAYDITIPGTDFRMSWNLGNTKTWAIDKGSVNEAGCIHTCQGLEFDYVGVIIGDDMKYSDGKVVTDYKVHPGNNDHAFKGLRKLYPDEKKAVDVADRIIKNTYRTLMSRGMKGCYVYCTDPRMREYLRSRIGAFRGEDA